MDHRLGVNLRDTRFGNVEYTLDFLEREAFEVIQRDHGALLIRETIDRAHERSLDFERFDGARDLISVVLERIEQRNLVAPLVR